MIEALKHILRRRFAAGGITYKIGGRVYVQRPLVLLQIEQLVEFVNPEMFKGYQVTNAVGIVRCLGDKLAQILAIVLTPREVTVEDKDLAASAAHLRSHVDIETAVKVVTDFLSCNPINSVFDRLTGIMAKVGMVASATATGSRSSSAPSPAATSPNGGTSS